MENTIWRTNPKGKFQSDWKKVRKVLCRTVRRTENVGHAPALKTANKYQQNCPPGWQCLRWGHTAGDDTLKEQGRVAKPRKEEGERLKGKAQRRRTAKGLIQETTKRLDFKSAKENRELRALQRGQLTWSSLTLFMYRRPGDNCVGTNSGWYYNNQNENELEMEADPKHTPTQYRKLSPNSDTQQRLWKRTWLQKQDSYTRHEENQAQFRKQSSNLKTFQKWRLN